MNKTRNWKYLSVKTLEQVLPYLFICLFVGILVSVQIRQHAFIAGADANFHMNQFYDAAMQIKTRHWNYFLSFFGFNHFGRMVNAIYGPFFMYINGQLLLWAKTWMNFEIIQDFILLSISGILFYILARKNYLSRPMSLIISFLYILSEPVMAWMLEQEFSGVGAILFPIILIQATQMVRIKRIHPIYLGITVAILFQTHVLTTLLGCLTLIPFFIYTLIENKGVHNKLHLCLQLLGSIIINLLLTANVWGTLLNLLHQRFIPTIPQGMPTPEGAVKLSQNYSNPSFVLNRTDIIILLVAIILGLLGIIIWKRSSVLFKITYFSGLIYTYLSTVYAPWHFIFHKIPGLEFQFQYPKRFLCSGVSMLLLTIVLALNNHDLRLIPKKSIFNKIIRIIFLLILSTCAVFNFGNQVHYINGMAKAFRSNDVVKYAFFHTDILTPKQDNELRKSYFGTNLAKPLHMAYQDTADYLPTNEKPIRTYNEYRNDGIFSGMEKQLQTPQEHNYYYHQVGTNQLRVYWYSNATGNQLLPIVKYRNTEIKLDGKTLHHIFISRVGAINIKVPKGYNELTVCYNAPQWLWDMLYVAITSWIIIIIWLIIASKFSRKIMVKVVKIIVLRPSTEK